jgi:hypothetical protein
VCGRIRERTRSCERECVASARMCGIRATRMQMVYSAYAVGARRVCGVCIPGRVHEYLRMHISADLDMHLYTCAGRLRICALVFARVHEDA